MGSSSLGKNTVKNTRLHSPTAVETKKINNIIENQIASAKNLTTAKRVKREFCHSVGEVKLTQNSFGGKRKATLHVIGTPGSSQAAQIASEIIYSQDPIEI